MKRTLISFPRSERFRGERCWSLDSQMERPVRIEVSAENFGSVVRTSYWICVGLFVMDLAIGLYLVDDWGTVPGLVGWLVWGFLMLDGLIIWYVFRKRALERQMRWRKAEAFIDALPTETLQNLIYSWAGILIVGAAGMIVEFTEAGLLFILSAGIGSICLLVSYPANED